MTPSKQTENFDIIDLDGVILEYEMAKAIQKESRNLFMHQVLQKFPELNTSRNPFIDLGPEAVGSEESYTACVQKKLGLPENWAVENCADDYPRLQLFMKQVITPDPVLREKILRSRSRGNRRQIIVSHNPKKYVRDAINGLAIGDIFHDFDIVDLAEMGYQGKNTRAGQQYLDNRFLDAYPRNRFRWNYVDDQMRNLEIPFKNTDNVCTFVNLKAPAANASCHNHFLKFTDVMDAWAEAA